MSKKLSVTALVLSLIVSIYYFLGMIMPKWFWNFLDTIGDGRIPHSSSIIFIVAVLSFLIGIFAFFKEKEGRWISSIAIIIWIIFYIGLSNLLSNWG